MKFSFFKICAVLMCAAWNMAQAGEPGTAAKLAHPQTMTVLAAARSGERIVAVGANGGIILSDDLGKTFYQARSVPTDFTLTDVVFVGKTGWAVGHGGVILRSDDSGVSWRIQRFDDKVDQPLYSVFFKDTQTGWAVGLWSLLLRTDDGGSTWRKVAFDTGMDKKGDMNLYKLFADKRGNLYVTSEQGTVFRSEDEGMHWTALATGLKGTLWIGVATDGGALVVGGLGGKMARSQDEGAHWTAVSSATTGGLTAIASDQGALFSSSLEGVIVISKDDGASWTVMQSGEPSLTTLVPLAAGRVMPFSKAGVVAK